ncbi:MAG TPA: type I pullulanase [Chitinophagaceae bacterium]|jgi:pullulanase|nr:type I pullulanase [Chitinophagaceae bacterium]
MKRFVMLLGFISFLFSGKAQLPDFSKYPVYNGKDLGLTYSAQNSFFRIWAPTAQQVKLYLYNNPTDIPADMLPMEKDKNGTWVITVKGDKKNWRYGFWVMINGTWSKVVPDPYAKAVDINGVRGVIIDSKETNPPGWINDKSPVFKNANDAVIYELHIRDASIAASSGIKNKGKFSGLTEKGTKNTGGLSTGLDHLIELGVTHVHLLPCFDFQSVDEASPNAKYNWGYDPLNYNVPDGSYSTEPNDGVTRIKEFKHLIKTFHENGLSVVMDVVYNHTAQTETSNFNQLVPGYYYRQTADGKFSNATACGNETASERPMFRKFMLESMLYWVKEYHIDGFRIDLMGVHDIVTMNLISKELHKIRPDILLYGEGWTAGSSPLPDSLRAIKANAHRLDRIAVFSDDIRDGIKGSVFDHGDKGFASGKPGMEESIKFGIVASLKHPQVDYSKVNYSKTPYAKEPWNTVTYAECHDNHVLWDKLAISAKEATVEERISMHKLALCIVLTSQGISFLHAGTEFLRSKKGVENSYESPDSINAIDWDLKTKNADVVQLVKALIGLRKGHPAFRMTKAIDIASNIKFMDHLPAGVVGYIINGAAAGDSWKKIMVFFNGSKDLQKLTWTPEPWNFFNPTLEGGQLSVPATSGTTMDPYSFIIAYQ